MTGRDHPVLQAEGVAKSYGGRKILENVSISLGPGELVCLVGVSGAGKTTLFNILSGLERPDGGRVLLNGRDVTGAPGQVSYMLQRDLLLPHKKVLDNAALPLVIRGMKKREARAEAASYFPRFGLEGTEDKYPAQLSGGMRQRAALLRTFLGSREAALLDEPFSALDGFLKWQLEQELREVLERFPGPAVWVSHDRGEVYRNCSRVCVLEDGKSAPAASMAELMANPGTVAAARLSGCKNFAPVRPGPAPGLVEVPAWGLVLRAPWREGAAAVGLRADRIRPEEAGAVNAFPCQILRVTEDVSSVFAALRPEAASPGAPPLWMELAKDAWAALPDRERLWAAVRPEDLMLLK